MTLSFSKLDQVHYERARSMHHNEFHTVLTEKCAYAISLCVTLLAPSIWDTLQSLWKFAESSRCSLNAPSSAGGRSADAESAAVMFSGVQ